MIRYNWASFTTYYYVLLRTTTYYYVLLRTTTYYYVLLRTTTLCTCSIFVCRHKNNDMSTLLGHVHTYIPTDRQTDTQAYIHKSIQTYSYTYTWLQMVRPPQPTHRGGGAGTLCVYVISLFAYTIKMIYLPCVHMYIHTYIQTNHKSIQTNSYHT